MISTSIILVDQNGRCTTICSKAHTMAMTMQEVAKYIQHAIDTENLKPTAITITIAVGRERPPG